jgi:hypothetical protein
MTDKTVDTVSLVIAIVFLGLIVGAAFWDFYVWLLPGNQRSVSRVLNGWAHDFPPFVLLIGVIMGHLFWPINNK